MSSRLGDLLVDLSLVRYIADSAQNQGKVYSAGKLQTQMKHSSCSTAEIPVSCVITKLYLTLILYFLWQVAATSLEHGQVERMSMMHRDFRVEVGGGLVKSSLQPQGILVNASLRQPRTSIAMLVPVMS